MEIIQYLAEDGYNHFLLYPTMGINFTLWIIMVGSVLALIYSLFNKLLGN